MAITQIAAGAIAADNAITSVTVTAPACAADDILIAMVANRSATANVISPPASNGWTEITQANGGANQFQYALFWKLATGSAGDFVFTKASDDNVTFCGAIVAYRGQHLTVPIDATAVGASINASADLCTFPAFDPTSTAAHVLFCAFYNNDLLSWDAAMSVDTNPDCTNFLTVETTVGSDFGLAITSGDSDGSAIASRTWASNSTTNATNIGVVFALVPPAAASGTWPGWTGSRGGWW